MDRPAMGRAAVFLGTAVAAALSGLWAVSALGHGSLELEHPSIGETLLGSSLLLALSVIVPALVVRRAFGASLAEFGLGGPLRLRRLLGGTAAGLGAIAILVASISQWGGIRFAPAPQPWPTTIIDAAAYAAIFSLTALSEEGLFRGYLLIQLGRAIGFWPASLATSIVFAALHLSHGDETPVGLLQVAIFGLLMAFSVRRTGSLWFALGFHTAWDFGQTFLFGVADSGMTGSGSLLVPRLDGPDWLTGGAVGPEGSVFAPLLLIVLCLLMTTSRRCAAVREPTTTEALR